MRNGWTDGERVTASRGREDAPRRGKARRGSEGLPSTGHADIPLAAFGRLAAAIDMSASFQGYMQACIKWKSESSSHQINKLNR
jgi:hypothetical protein